MSRIALFYPTLITELGAPFSYFMHCCGAAGLHYSTANTTETVAALRTHTYNRRNHAEESGLQATLHGRGGGDGVGLL